MSELVTQRAGDKVGSNVVDCGASHLARILRELHYNGVELKSTGGMAQTLMLQKVLTFRGARGLNTYEGAAAGYSRLAARVRELREAGWIIKSKRENLFGPDGLEHRGVARYVLIGKRNTPAALRSGSSAC
jgi:hypothetical protein